MKFCCVVALYRETAERNSFIEQCVSCRGPFSYKQKPVFKYWLDSFKSRKHATKLAQHTFKNTWYSMKQYVEQNNLY